MFCHKCGAEIPDESQFCSKCGAKVMLSNTDAPKLENHDLETDVITEKRERLPVKQIKRRRRKKKHWLLLILTILILAFLVNEAVRFSNIDIYAYSTVTINSKDPISSKDEEKMDSLFRDKHLMVINDSDYYLFNLDSGLGDKMDTWTDSLKENGYTDIQIHLDSYGKQRIVTARMDR